MKMTIDGFSVNVYDVEKCVCDAVKFRNKIGTDVCSEIISNYLERPERNISKLIDYANSSEYTRLLRNTWRSNYEQGNRQNYGKSIRDRLLNIAKSENIYYQTVLTRYFQERLIYRMSQTSYRQNFYLKGGALMYAHDRFAARPTLDIDFLGNNISNNGERIVAAFREICSVPCKEDGVKYDVEHITSKTSRNSRITTE